MLGPRRSFFCIRLAPASQPIFAFEWENPIGGNKQQLTWTHLSQGFKNTPTIFGEALASDLEPFQPERCGCWLLQYVDDLLLAAETWEECCEGTPALLHWLAEAESRVSRKKAQICKEEVRYLGFVLREGTRLLDQSTKEVILRLPTSLGASQGVPRGHWILQDLDSKVFSNSPAPI